MKTPCETIVWSIVPLIKKEFAKNLVENFGLTQKEASLKLDTTEAAISRYMSGKRGILELNDSEISDEIKKSAIIISKENGQSAVNEICKICKLIRSKNLFDDADYTC